MKNFRKKVLAVMGASIMLTGCGQVVQNMPDVPVMSGQMAVTQNDTDVSETDISETDISETDTSETDVQTTVSSKRGYIVSATRAVTTASTKSTSQRMTAHVAGTTGVVNHNSSVQRGTTHVVPANPNVNTAGLTTRSKTTTTTTTASTTSLTTTNNKTSAVTTDTTATTTKEDVVTTTTTTTIAKPDNPQELLEQMTLKEKVYQMFIVKPEYITGVYPTTVSDETTKEAIENYPVGGIICFADNLVSIPQTKSMLENIQQYAKDSSGVGLFTAIDEEGGTIARAAQKLGTTAFYNMQYYGESNDAGQGYNIGYTIGSDLHALGFNLDFAPVADININANNELGSRIFSSDPSIVANMATSVARGLQDAGISATFKHFPGLGAEDGSTHDDSFVIIDRTVDQLRESEFVPFRTGIDAGVDFVMVGHQIVTGFGDNLPADLSYTAVTEYLRNELGFNGITVTDAHDMNTITNVYSSGEASVMSIKAGIDIILMPDDLQSAVDAVCNAVENGEISESRIDESVIRILNQKYELGLFNS